MSLSLAAVAQDLDNIVIPRKTEIFITLQRSLNSKAVSPGDKFPATVEVPVTLDDKIILPVGSYVIGHVMDTATAGYFKGKAHLLLGFDTVILPSGVTRKLEAVLDSAEGYASDPAQEDGQIQAPGSQKEEVAAGAAKGAVTGMITGATVGLFRGGIPHGVGVGSLVGAAGGALLALLKKGEEVELPKGSTLTIQLQEGVRFVKPEPAPEGKRLDDPEG